MTKIAETYFRLGIQLNETDRNKFKTYLRREARHNLKELFHQAPEIEVYLDEGSIRGWIVAAGLLINGIEHYGSFRDGIDYLVSDARAFSDRMLSSVRRTGIAENDIVRTERRTATQGKISRLLDQIDELKAHGRDLSKSQYEEELSHIRNRAEKIFRLVEEDEDRDIIRRHIPANIRRTLPKHLPQRPSSEIPVALRPEEVELAPRLIRRFSLDDQSRTITAAFAVDPRSVPTQKREPIYHVETLPSGFKLTTKRSEQETAQQISIHWTDH